MLDAVRLNPLSVTLAAVTLAPELIVNVAIVTSAVSVGWKLTVDTINALSWGPIGTPVSQFAASDQFVLVPPHQVRSTPPPPKVQFRLFPESVPLLVAVMSVPSRASESCAFTKDTSFVPELFSDQLLPGVVDFM
jgi:hypothetical protein